MRLPATVTMSHVQSAPWVRSALIFCKKLQLFLYDRWVRSDIYVVILLVLNNVTLQENKQ
jgi:hypothetical protein